MRLTSFLCAAIAAAVQIALCGAAFAQSPGGDTPAVEWEKRMGQDGRLEKFGADLLGDQIDPSTGAITFEHTDVIIPGNSRLDVSVRRRRSQGYYFSPDVAADFGDWALLAPRIHAISGPNGWTGNRCSNSFLTSFPTINIGWTDGEGNIGSISYTNSQYSEGVTLDVPGAGSQQLLEGPPGAQWTGGPNGTVKYVTTDNWRITCIPATNGGEGFLAVAPNGDQYRFDYYISRPYHYLGTYGGVSFLDRKR
ncbi:MAG: hypothetical protein ACOZAA_04060, partial [Pseudomonadota bacterium]